MCPFLSVVNLAVAEDHPLKLSVTTLAYDSEKGKYSLDLRMFFDDFMVVTRGGVEEDYHPSTLPNKPSRNDIKNYLAANLKIAINGTPIDLKVEKVAFEELTIYVRFKLANIPTPDMITGIDATDTIFVDKFVNQRNVIHIELPERKRRSLLFNAYHRKGSISW